MPPSRQSRRIPRAVLERTKAVLDVRAERREFAPYVASTKTELEATVAEEIDDRGLLRDVDGCA
jgi:hypothetical protein